MNNSELEKAYDEYEKLLDEKNYLEPRSRLRKPAKRSL